MAAAGRSRPAGKGTVTSADGSPPGPSTEERADDAATPTVADPAGGGTAGAADEPPPPSGGGRRRALLVSLVAWLLPGFGHLVLGQWLRGAAFSALVVATASVGVALYGRLYWFGYGFSAAPIDPLPNVESPVVVAAASLVSLALGVPAMALRWLAGYQGDVTAPGYEYGTAFLLTAGLMNVLLVLDAWDEAR